MNECIYNHLWQTGIVLMVVLTALMQKTQYKVMQDVTTEQQYKKY
jgi:hypothetical protein